MMSELIAHAKAAEVIGDEFKKEAGYAKEEGDATTALLMLRFSRIYVAAAGQLYQRAKAQYEQIGDSPL